MAQRDRTTRELPACDLGRAGRREQDDSDRAATDELLQCHNVGAGASDWPAIRSPAVRQNRPAGGHDFALEHMPSLPSTVRVSPEQAAALAEFYPAGEAPPLPVALQEQIGLTVVAAERLVVLVIDHVERLSAN